MTEKWENNIENGGGGERGTNFRGFQRFCPFFPKKVGFDQIYCA